MLTRSKIKPLIFFIIFIEGYIVLASELIAIRILAANLSNTTDVIAIVISAVLLPLALGYFYGGKFADSSNKHQIRKKLVKNFVNSLVCFAIAFNYYFVFLFFTSLNVIFKNNYLITTTLYSCIFLIYPVFLLGQTIPMVTNYFEQKRLSSLAGRILCFSTIGSLCGSLLTTIILMPLIGLNNTVIATITLLSLLVFAVEERRRMSARITSFIFLALTVLSNSTNSIKNLNIVEDNQYHTVKIYTQPLKEDPSVNKTYFTANNAAYSTMLEKDGKIIGTSDYIDYIEGYINPLPPEDSINVATPVTPASTQKDILVLGAGGFNLGYNDTKNNYTFVDIDGRLKDVAEKYFHKKPLSENKHFEVVSAKLFVKNADKKYDFILLDVFSGLNIPQQLITIEFFQSLKKIMKDDGIIAINLISDGYFSNKFATKFDNTVRAVFKNYYLAPVQNTKVYSGKPGNFVYIIKNNIARTIEVYSDDKSEYYQDRLQNVQ